MSPRPSIHRLHPLSCRGGYTLLEVVIASGLAGLLSVILYTTFTFLQQSSFRLRSYSDMHESAQLAVGYLGRDIRQAVAIVGASDSWLSLLLPSVDGTSARVHYRIDAEAGTLHRITPGRPPEHLLLKGLDDPRFFYENRLGKPVSPEEAFQRVGFTGVLRRPTFKGEATNFVVSSAFIPRNLAQR